MMCSTPPLMADWLEKEVISSLANKFTPFIGFFDNEGTYDTCADEIADGEGLTDAVVVSVNSNKQPFAFAQKQVSTAVLASIPSTKKSSRFFPPRKINRISSSLPTADDPIDETFCMTLYSKRDKGRINPAHLIIRREVLEVRRTLSGKVFFCCACCKHRPRVERAKYSTLAPQSVDTLYRAMVRFMMFHVPNCEHIHPKIKGLSPKSNRSEDGTKKYWIKSAKKMGLMDGKGEKMSIVYCCPVKK